MNAKRPRLSGSSIIALEQIAEGRTYEQILSRFPDLTYLDIFTAAGEALELAAEERDDYAARLARMKQRYPRAYERWSKEDDTRLRTGITAATPIKEIARQLQRQPSAIRSHIAKLGLGDDFV